MEDTKKKLIRTAIRVVLPSLLGAAGALMATTIPAYYAAMCAAYIGV